MWEEELCKLYRYAGNEEFISYLPFLNLDAILFFLVPVPTADYDYGDLCFATNWDKPIE